MSESHCYRPVLTQAPLKLIDESGKLQQGLFDGSVADLNLPAFRLHSVLD